MDEFAVEFVAAAARDLRDIAPAARPALLDAIALQLRQNPFPRGKLIKRLKGFRIPTYELRVYASGESYRVVYRIDGRRVVVLMIPPRKLLARYLRRLKK